LTKSEAEEEEAAQRERERINRMNSDTLIEATFDSKIAHRNTIRHLINDIDMLGENKQSIIWRN
jgi:hypothetical protein